MPPSAKKVSPAILTAAVLLIPPLLVPSPTAGNPRATVQIFSLVLAGPRLLMDDDEIPFLRVMHCIYLPKVPDVQRRPRLTLPLASLCLAPQDQLLSLLDPLLKTEIQR